MFLLNSINSGVLRTTQTNLAPNKRSCFLAIINLLSAFQVTSEGGGRHSEKIDHGPAKATQHQRGLDGPFQGDHRLRGLAR